MYIDLLFMLCKDFYTHEPIAKNGSALVVQYSLKVISLVWLKSWKEKAKKLKTEIYALYLAYRDPRVPWYAKAFIAAIVGYALCPLDLIPDFIPVLGYVDDIILIPAGITIAVKMIPQDVLEECRERARSEPFSKRTHWVAVVLIVLIWLLAIYVTIKIIWVYFMK